MINNGREYLLWQNDGTELAINIARAIMARFAQKTRRPATTLFLLATYLDQVQVEDVEIVPVDGQFWRNHIGVA